MSEGILKALMKLFAYVAFRAEDARSRRSVVENFLNQQLNHRLVSEYLSLFDNYFNEHQKKLEDKNRFHKRHSAGSVKILKIAYTVNEELTHYQKVIVLIQLIEFLNSGIGINNIEKEVINTVASTFNIDEEETILIYNFVLSLKSHKIPGSNKVLIIDGKEKNKHPRCKHLYRHNLKGTIAILHIESANLFIFRFDTSLDLFMNGQLIPGIRINVLRPGSALRNKLIKPIYYSDVLGQFTSDKIATPILFEVDDVTYHFNKKSIGLHNTSFTSESGKLVGIMGSSGAGKSTLINVLSGSYFPTNGAVRINGIDLHNEPERIEGLIGYVSQDDLLIEDLTVYQNLYYNAKLCFGNLTEYNIKKKVINLLKSLGLYEIREMKVGSPLNKKISGGQRKRLNIALELIREPAVLFLDEPTSGLSSKDSDNIIDLLKELAIKGKLVFVVIHQPSSDIFKMFNQLLVLDEGGYLIYNGDPVESIQYFKSCINHANWEESECPHCGNVNAEQILNIIGAQVVDEYGNLTPSRKLDPFDWHQRFKKYYNERLKPAAHNEYENLLPKITFKVPDRFNQFLIFLKRDLISKFTNNQYLMINFLETPVLALLLSYIIRYYNVDSNNTAGYIFAKNPNLTIYIIMAVIIAIFVGLTVSAEEIINDRKILKRESFLNLSRLSYLFSKVAILVGLSALQSFLFVLVGNAIIGIKGMFFEYWLILFSSSVFANMLGLNISDSFRKTVNIYIIIPFLIIPQLILSGIFISFDRFNPDISSPNEIPWYGEMITTRWAFEALAVNQFINNDYEKHFYVYDKVKSQARFKKEYWLPAMSNKLEKALKLFESKNDPEHLSYILSLLQTEFRKNITGAVDINNFFNLNTYKQDFGRKVYYKTKEYLNALKKYYRELYNTSDRLLDKEKLRLTRTPELREQFIKMKNDYSNEDLERFLRNKNNFFSSKIIEYNGQFYQKVDPVFRDPEHPFIKAHFFSPAKNVFNKPFDTFYVNLAVIWFFNLLLFISLNYRLLPRIINYGFFVSGSFKNKRKKNGHDN
jgi:ABC-type multidrug transport system ATPase subunit